MSEHFAKLYKAVLYDTDLKPTARLIHAYIIERMDDEGVAWPGHRLIAKDLGLHVSTVTSAVIASAPVANPGAVTSAPMLRPPDVTAM